MRKNYIVASIVGLSIALASIFIMSFTSAEKSKKGTQFRLVTTIESVVPGGLGRSRMITSDQTGQLQEIKMENFFSLVGINFENVKNNDRTITDKMEQMTAEGWELVSVNIGTYAGNEQGKITGGGVGIFVTRYLFKK
jgi:hypothetical protein